MTAKTYRLRKSRLVQYSPVFYGWVVCFVATLGLIATAPGQSFSVSLFIDHYITDFGLDRTAVSGLYGLGTFLAALSLIWVGKQIDRHGNRRMSIIITILFAAALAGSSLISGPFTILLSFIAIRGLGQGALSLVSSTAIAQWFRRRRGWAMGLSLLAFALFQRVYLPWMQSFIEAYGWRAAWLLTGASIAFIVMPLLAVFLRNRPEEFGLLPDGLPVSRISEDAAMEENWQLKEAMQAPLFWVFTVARVLAAAWGTALIFHQASLFASLGHSPAVAANTIALTALTTGGVILIAGWFVNRVRPNYLVGVQMAGLAAATALTLIMTEPWLLFLYTIAYGIFSGAGTLFDGTVWVNLFGRKYQGEIRGFVTMTGVLGSAFGPLVFGVAYDYLGGYRPAIWLGIVLAMSALAAALRVEPLTKRKAV
ncbi:MAG: MFS transporter [Chloroflexi bacterium]|nr:MFS transporter [Chloroflexota bacterium]